MIFALANGALIATALGLFFLADPNTFFWFLEPAHSRYGFFFALVLLFAAAEWINAQRYESAVRLMTSWGTTLVAIAVLGLQFLHTVDLKALVNPGPATEAAQTANTPPKKRPAKQAAAPLQQATTYGEVEIKARRNGNFYTRAKVNGSSVRVLIDTGATFVALRYEDAEALSLDPLNLDYTVEVNTANGVSYAAPVELDEVTIGGITVNDVEAIVTKPGTMHITLLGMSYLGRAGGFRVEGDTLVLGN
ncbi:MAG: TIGR02281 family clan AA aspartic protease [Pseudomonadota bacterium]